LAKLVFVDGRVNTALLTALNSRFDRFGQLLEAELPRVPDIRAALSRAASKLKAPQRQRAEIFIENVFNDIEKQIERLKAR
jgi:hypothetical protein